MPRFLFVVVMLTAHCGCFCNCRLLPGVWKWNGRMTQKELLPG